MCIRSKFCFNYSTISEEFADPEKNETKPINFGQVFLENALLRLAGMLKLFSCASQKDCTNYVVMAATVQPSSGVGKPLAVQCLFSMCFWLIIA